MDLNTAIRISADIVMRSLEAKARGDVHAAVAAMKPLIRCFDENVPPDSGIVTFQEPFEKHLHMFLSGTEEEPPGFPIQLNAIYHGYGSMLIDTGDLIESARCLSRATDLNPASPMAMFELAEVAKIIRNMDLFERITRNTFAVDIHAAQLARSYRNMAYLMSEKGKWKDASAFCHLSMRYEDSDAARREIEFIEDNAGMRFPCPSVTELDAACAMQDVPYGPSGAVRGLVKSSLMHGCQDAATYFADILLELHPGQSLNNLLKTPRPDHGTTLPS